MRPISPRTARCNVNPASSQELHAQFNAKTEAFSRTPKAVMLERIHFPLVEQLLAA
jgi:hypothetical protein